jgi:hypothetical protein
MKTGFFVEKLAREMQRGPAWRRVVLPFSAQARIVMAILPFFGGSEVANAQHQASVAELADTPTPKLDAGEAQQKAQKGTLSNTIGLLSRRSLFFPELAYQKGPLSGGRKLELAADESIAPSRFVGAAFIAGVDQATNSPAGYGQGWDAYGKRLGSFLASSASQSMFGTFLLPAIFRQDPRYFVKPDASFKQRVGNALRRVVVTRTDSGGEAFNVSEILGALMAEGLANSYLPDDERTAGKTFERFGIRIGVGAAGNILKEYWPNLFKSLGLRKLSPSGRSRQDAPTATAWP